MNYFIITTVKLWKLEIWLENSKICGVFEKWLVFGEKKSRHEEQSFSKRSELKMQFLKSMPPDHSNISFFN